MSTPTGGFDLVVLSPHLDDGILSCGGRMARLAEEGGSALLVTLFAGDDPVDPPGELAASLRRVWNLPPGGVVAARRAEDRTAAARLGAAAEHWPFPEALYRTDADGAPLYPDLASLYGELRADEAGLVADLATRIAALPPAALLLAPLGVGGHVDHRLVRAAAEASGRPVAFYEEFPYSEWKWFAVRRALGGRGGWRPEELALAARHLERKQEAILAYASQVPALFRSAGRLGRQLRRQARRAGGERIWHRRPGRPPR